MQVQSLGQEDPLEESLANNSSVLAWEIPWTEEPGGLQSIGSQSRTRLKWLCTHMHTYIVLSLWKQFKWHQAICPYVSIHFNCVIAAYSFRAVETSGVRQLNHPHFADRGSNAQGASVTCFIQNHIDIWWVSAQCMFCHTALLASQNFRA